MFIHKHRDVRQLKPTLLDTHVEKHFKRLLRSRNDKQRSNEGKEKEKNQKKKKNSPSKAFTSIAPPPPFLSTPEYQTALAQSLGLRPNTRLNSSIRGVPWTWAGLTELCRKSDMAQKPGHDGDCIWMKRMAVLIRILRSWGCASSCPSSEGEQLCGPDL